MQANQCTVGCSHELWPCSSPVAGIDRTCQIREGPAETSRAFPWLGEAEQRGGPSRRLSGIHDDAAGQSPLEEWETELSRGIQPNELFRGRSCLRWNPPRKAREHGAELSSKVENVPIINPQSRCPTGRLRKGRKKVPLMHVKGELGGSACRQQSTRFCSLAEQSFIVFFFVAPSVS